MKRIKKFKSMGVVYDSQLKNCAPRVNSRVKGFLRNYGKGKKFIDQRKNYGRV